MSQEMLIDFLKQAVSPSHSAEAACRYLCNHGFEPLQYENAWTLQPGGKYVMKHHGTAAFAFVVGEDYRPGGMLRMAAAHTDFPCLRIKPNADFVTDGYAQVNVEVYGSPILNTWFDRPLGIAGRVVIRSGSEFAPYVRLYRSTRPVMTIPNLAIHLNRDINKGVAINNQIDLMPIMNMLPDGEWQQDYFLDFLAEELGVEKDNILDFDLGTFCMDEPQYIGPDKTLLSASALDNQTSVAALVEALSGMERKDGINLIALFDHEEIGNQSKQGAASVLLHDLVIRILCLLGCDREMADRSLYSAMLLSVDVAQAMHPNHKEKMDITNQPVLGKGFCIKEACSQSYATDVVAVSILRQICDKRKIPYQHYVNRSDIQGGGTLGSVASTMVPIRTVDIGIPLLAMHSSRELMAVSDYDMLCSGITAFFAS